MQVWLEGTLGEVWECVQPVAILADWMPRRVSERDHLYELSPLDSEGSATAWLRLTPERNGATVTLWLPDEGDPAQRDKLRAAMLSIDEPTENSDEALVNRLRRIEGQIRGLQRMVESGRDCSQVMTQFAAVGAALRQAAATMVGEHLVTCIRDDIAGGGDGSQVNQKLLSLLF